MSDIDKFKIKIPFINSYLLAAVFFFIPIKIGPAYILSGLMLLLWLLEGNLRDKWESLCRHPLTWIFWLYFLLPFISLLWSSDLEWGLKMAKRGIFFLLFPLFVSVTRKEHIKLYISSFIASVGMTELLSYYNWFQLHYFPGLPEGIRSGNDNWQIAPFVNHIMYNPILAFSVYLLGHAVLFEQLNVHKKYTYWIFLITISINMLISGGRSGQVGFFAMICLLVFQRFARRPVIAGFVAVGVCVVVFTTAYQASDLFRQRTDLAVHQVLNYKQVVNSSVGLRINMYVNTFRMFLESPFLGIGVGDFPAEYARINKQYSPQWATVFNPHNQYLFALSTTGVLGGAVLICILFLPPYLARAQRDDWSRVRIALPVLFAVICLGESYLWRSNTSLLFVLFTAVFYLDLPVLKRQDFV
ncbi:O-antigen ligase family protein [Trichlorobacter sp.]|uniref:O-antigen ligase family protein n=1 Tax=Trichlorobacter sp. TaxID=2911007 RepID=UPI002A364CE8|nr:O-antigen ligase family protein [Trichlorobacter sp.]MDY0385355.1 O-antigen ligase family protein [Trichlorobacter sp.]